jgi:hypothetical protein
MSSGKNQGRGNALAHRCRRHTAESGAGPGPVLSAPRLVIEDGIILLTLQGYPLIAEGPTMTTAVAAPTPDLRAWA